jgi:hypothetical protein
MLPVKKTFSLGMQRILALLVLDRLVRLVLAALFTESSMGFRSINHDYRRAKTAAFFCK